MHAQTWDVVVVGSANVDYQVRGPHLPRPGETAQGEVFQEGPGGKGANGAVAAARLGARVAMVARVGKDARGELLLDRLQAEGVETRYILRDTEAPTGVALIQVDQQGHKQIQVAPGANHRLTVDDIRAAGEVIQAARALLMQLEIPLASVLEAARLAHEAKVRTVLDPAPAILLPEDLLNRLDMIRPNSGEAEVLTGVPVRDRASAREAADRLLRCGVGAVAVQAGEEGNLLVWHEGELFLPRIPIQSVDETGAGDAFAAALAVMLAENRPLAEAGAFASAMAALATTKLGAQAGLPRREEVLALMNSQQNSQQAQKSV